MPLIRETPDTLIEVLRSWFFASDRDITLQSGRQVTLGNGQNVEDALSASFVTMALSGDLANERKLTAGSGLSLVDGGAGGNATLSVTTTTGHVVQEEGVGLTQRTNLNFTGAYVTASDDAGGDASVVSILEDTEVANTVLAGPASGGDATPAFRALTVADLDGLGAVPVGGVIFWPSTAGPTPTNWSVFSAASGKFLVGADAGTFTNGSTGGTETIDIQHAHGPGTLATDNDSHTHGPGTLDTDNDAHTHGPGTLATDNDSHTHGVGTYAIGNTALSTLLTSGGVMAVGGATLVIINPSSHNHSITGASANDTHDHAVDAGVTASDSHDHGVNAGVTASDSHGHDVTSGTTATALSSAQSILPPYLVGTWIQFDGP